MRYWLRAAYTGLGCITVVHRVELEMKGFAGAYYACLGVRTCPGMVLPW